MIVNNLKYLLDYFDILFGLYYMILVLQYV